MKLFDIRALILAGAASLVLAVGSMASGPAELEAAICDGPGTVLCQKNEMCADFIFYTHCTTNYDYYMFDPDGYAIVP